MEDTDNDSVLMLRQMYLTLLAYQGLGQLTVQQVGSSFLEHPMDPMECSSAARCSSIWVTRAYIQWANALHHSLIKFDECRLGQVVVKSTTLSSAMRHGAHPRGEKLNSSDLSQYPEQMMQGLAAAILCRAGTRPGGAEAGGHGAPSEPNNPPEATEGTISQHAGKKQRQSLRLKAGQQALAGLTLGSLPVSASDNPEVRTPTQPAGRTLELRGGTLPLQPWARHCMEISDRTQISPTRLCTSTWPSNSALLGTGVGSPHLDGWQAAAMGPRSVSSHRHGDKLQESLSLKNGSHPFPEDLLEDIREILAPPDHQFPQHLEQGVPLRVTDPPLALPGIKKELKGEEPEYPTGRGNYPLAHHFSELIRGTFLEEVSMGMVEGPLTKVEAAARCGGPLSRPRSGHR